MGRSKLLELNIFAVCFYIIIFALCSSLGFSAQANKSKKRYKIDHEMAQSLKCSYFFSHFERKYFLPKNSLHSIALKESGKVHSLHNFSVPWPWTANVEGKAYYFSSKAKAVDFINAELRKGKTSIDVGCMQINLKHHGMRFRSVSQAIEPRFNIEYAASFLNENFQKTGNWQQAIAYYHSRTSELGAKYSKSVFKIAKSLPEKKRNIVKFYAGKSQNRRLK